ncbi:(2Fe-2S)-binding protein [Shimia thalassica]|nr:(2Fe-2S)-binding protein [Shimia thalassica]
MQDSRFERRTSQTANVSFTLDGVSVTACAGDTLAAALLAHGGAAFRTTGVSGAPKLPFCMMGVCFECLVELDGQPNVQSCMVEVQNGMTVRRHSGFRSLGDAR